MQKVKGPEGLPENPWKVQGASEYQKLNGGGGGQEPTQEQIEAFKAALREEVEREKREAEAAAEAAAAAEKARLEAVERARMMMVQETVADNDTSRVTVRNFGSVVVDAMDVPPAYGSNVHVSLKRKPAAGAVQPPPEAGNPPPVRPDAPESVPAFYAAAATAEGPAPVPVEGAAPRAFGPTPVRKGTVPGESLPEVPGLAPETPVLPAPAAAAAVPGATPMPQVEGLRLTGPVRLTATESAALSLALGPSDHPTRPPVPAQQGAEGSRRPGSTAEAPESIPIPAALISTPEAPAPGPVVPGSQAPAVPAATRNPEAPHPEDPEFPAPDPVSAFVATEVPVPGAALPEPALGDSVAIPGAEPTFSTPAPFQEASTPEAPLAQFPGLAAIIRSAVPANGPAEEPPFASPPPSAPSSETPEKPSELHPVLLAGNPQPGTSTERPVGFVDSLFARRDPTSGPETPALPIPAAGAGTPESPAPTRVESASTPDSVPVETEARKEEEEPQDIPMVQSGSDLPVPGFGPAEPAPENREAPSPRGEKVTEAYRPPEGTPAWEPPVVLAHAEPIPSRPEEPGTPEESPEGEFPALEGHERPERGERPDGFRSREESEWDLEEPEAVPEEERVLIRKAEEDPPPDAPTGYQGLSAPVPFGSPAHAAIPVQYRDMPPGGTPFTQEVLGLVSRVLVTADPYSDVQEIRMTFREDILPGTEIRFRTEGGILMVELHTASTETADLLRAESDGLRSALESGTGSEVEIKVVAIDGQEGRHG